MTSRWLFILALSKLSLAIAPTVTFSQSPRWQQGNGPYQGGTIRSMITDSIGNLLACTPGWDGGGGVFRSTDGGYHWRQIYSGTDYIQYMTIDRNSNIYVSLLGRGIAFSSDAGENWVLRNNGLSSLDITALGTTSSNAILAATWAPPWSPALYRSTDQGVSWTQVTTCPLDSTAVSIAVSTSGDIYMGTVGSKLYKSNGDGTSWTIVNTSANYIGHIVTSPNGSVFFSANNGVFRSTDNGLTWSRLTTIWGGLTITDAAIVYLSYWPSGGLWKSTDNGNSWSRISGPDSVLHYLHWHPQSESLFGGIAGRGVIVTRNEGTTWDIATIPMMRIFSLTSKSNGILYAGTDNGFFRSTNLGTSWEMKPIIAGLPSAATQNSVLDIAVTTSGHVFAALYGAGVWKTTNDGEQWTQSLPATLGVPDGYSLAIDSLGNIYAGMGSDPFYGTATIFKSTDDGITWEEKRQGLTSGTVRGIICISGQTLLAATWGNGVFRTTNGGEIWIASSSGLPSNSRIFSFAKTATGLIFSCSIDSGAYVSSNGGLSWARSSSGITTPNVYRLAVNSSGTLFAGTLTGVFRSTNNGQSWTEFSDGIANPFVFSLVFDALGYLHAGTIGGSTFRTIQSATNIDPRPFELPTSFHLAQNYPNPFNSVTRIQFDLPNTVRVTATIYDILGRQVAILADRHFTPGPHSVEWDACDLPSGIYFYRFQIGEQMKTKKAILLK